MYTVAHDSSTWQSNGGESHPCAGIEQKGQDGSYMIEAGRIVGKDDFQSWMDKWGSDPSRNEGLGHISRLNLMRVHPGGRWWAQV